MIAKRWAMTALMLVFGGAAHAACPDGSSFNTSLGFCADASHAYGPFTQAMTDECVAKGGGPACTEQRALPVGSTTINVQRWSLPFAQWLRGTGACPQGAVPDPALGNRCTETVGSTKNVYGPFEDALVAKCTTAGGGPACFTNRWTADFYRTLSATRAAAQNKFGVWVYYIERHGMTHAQLADKLQALGIKRVFIKIADGGRSCGLFPDACLSSTVSTYKARGIEPWAWSYNYPGNVAAQAAALTTAAKAGYQGYIVDVEKEFLTKLPNGQPVGLTTELHDLMKAFTSAQAEARAKGWIKGDWTLAASTYGYLKTNPVRVDILDQYVDAHMPQTYLDIFGPSFPADPKKWIEKGNCEYRAAGAKKPIWHVASSELGRATAAQQDAFMKVAGPHASMWLVPGGPVPQSVWTTWSQMNWKQGAWEPTACSAGNYELRVDGSQPGVPTPPPVAAPVTFSCPDGAAFESKLGFCADTQNAFGPFPDAMVAECKRLGGGEPCTETQPVGFAQGKVTMDLSRWSKTFAQGLRGNASCPRGTTSDARFDGLCVEGQGSGGLPEDVYGPFPPALVSQCQQKGGGTACLLQRWSASFYLQLKGRGTTVTSFPYYNQNHNRHEPRRACNITSIAMALDFHKVTDPAKLGMRTPDYLYNKYGLHFDAASLANIFNAEAAKAGSPVRDRWTGSGTISQLRSLVSAGKPVVIHGWFTPPGHIVQVIGFDGANYIVNDPNGVWNLVRRGGYNTAKSGQAVKYPAAAFDAVITDNGRGNDLLMHVFQ